jgi:hypothetical protein
LLTPVVIEAFGSTSLAGVGGNFYHYRGGTGPLLKSDGIAVVAGQFGAWSPIDAEQTEGGYDVVWRNSATGQFTAWDTDSNGDYISNIIGAVSGSSSALQSLETTFQQDLNGDGTVGIFVRAIETPTSIEINSNPMFEPELAKIDGSDDNACALDTRLTASTAVNHPIVDPTELSPFTTISDNLAALLHDTHSLFPLTNVGLGIQEYPIDHARLAEIHIADLQASKVLIL